MSARGREADLPCLPGFSHIRVFRVVHGSARILRAERGILPRKSKRNSVDLSISASPFRRSLYLVAFGYPTQKPLALLDRIINASSNENDIVLDAFCGCGTALVAAQKLKRQWIGIDISPTSCRVMAKRLKDKNVCGLPESEDLWAIGRGFVVRDLPCLSPKRIAHQKPARAFPETRGTHPEKKLWHGVQPAFRCRCTRSPDSRRSRKKLRIPPAMRIF